MNSWRCGLLLGLLLTGQMARAQDAPAPVEIGRPPDARFAELAQREQRAGRDFDQIFAALCRAALAPPPADEPALPLRDRVRSVFGGLWIWTQHGGRPRLQGRQDLALHFIGGGAFQGYWDAGRSAAIIKERADALGPGNRYDLDDLAATMLGARWMDLATRGSEEQTRAWLTAWAERRLTLNQSLPALKFGQLPAGEAAPAAVIKEVWQATEAELQLPR